jgi:hypothetical protein
MKNTSIVPAQKATSQIVPKPTRTDIIDALVIQTIEERKAENAIREEKRNAIRLKLDKEIEKFKKKKVALIDLDINWESVSSSVCIRYATIKGSPEMQKLSDEIRKLHELPTNKEYVKAEVVQKMKEEMINSIMDQPGVKEAFKSTIAKLGLNG